MSGGKVHQHGVTWQWDDHGDDAFRLHVTRKVKSGERTVSKTRVEGYVLRNWQDVWMGYTMPQNHVGDDPEQTKARALVIQALDLITKS